MPELCDLTATSLRQLIGLKEVSPVELLESCIKRIKNTNNTLNALVTLNYKNAKKEAKIAENQILKGKNVGPLHGLPIGIKDLEETKNLKTTFGSLLYKDYTPKVDQQSVASIRAAGGIILGKTNTPEFGAGANTTNRVYGSTGNPFNPALTCGGSSGGSAVALSTGMVTLASGSDYGGSLRIPAGFCGVVGFRPTPGLVPDETRTIALNPFSVLGPMGRTVSDTALLLSAMIRYDHRDPFSRSIDASFSNPLPPIDLSKLKVAISDDLGVAPIDNNIRKVFYERVKIFQHTFAKTEYCDPIFDDNIHEAFEITRAMNFAAEYSNYVKKHRDRLSPNIITNTELCKKYTAEDVAWAKTEQTRFYKKFEHFMKTFDILISPTNSVTPFPHTKLYMDQINNVPMPNYVRWLCPTYALTVVLPSVCSIPCGRDHKKMPFSIQITSRGGSDRFVLTVSHALEQLFSMNPLTARPVPNILNIAKMKKSKTQNITAS